MHAHLAGSDVLSLEAFRHHVEIGVRTTGIGSLVAAIFDTTSILDERRGGAVTITEHRELMAQARAETGLDDFGDDSFREGLERLVRALRREAPLNAIGEMA